MRPLGLAVSALILFTIAACARSQGGPINPDLPEKRMSSRAQDELCGRLFSKNKRGRRLSWKGRQPLVFSFDETFPEKFRESVRNAATTWNRAAGFELIQIAAAIRPASRPADDKQNTFYYLGDDESSRAIRNKMAGDSAADGGLAATLIKGRGNRIEDADIVFDGGTTTFSTFLFRLGTHDVESVALHEFGHALGLDHNPDRKSTMYYAEFSFGFASRSLDDDSIFALNCEYR